MLHYITLENAGALDAYVAAQPKSPIMQTSLWGKVKKDWRWHGLLCTDEAGKPRGSAAILEHRLRYFPSSLLYAPCGPLFEDEAAFRELLEGIRKLGREVGAYLFRMDPQIPETDAAFLAMMKRCGFRRNAATDFSLFQPRMNYVLPLNGLTEQTLPESYHPSTRRNIRLAQRRGVVVRQGSEADLPAFMALMEKTAQRCGFPDRSEDYFRALLAGLGEHAGLYLAREDGRIVAASIAGFYGHRASFLYGCSDEEHFSCHANELLQWHMQLEALRRGCDTYDFRGVEGYPTEDNPKFGLHRYKQGFGAKFTVYAGQFDLPLRPWLAKVMSLCR